MKTFNIFLDKSLNKLSDPRPYLWKHPRCHIVEASKDADLTITDPFLRKISYDSFWVNRVRHVSWLTHKAKLARLIRNAEYAPKTWVARKGKLPQSLRTFMTRHPDKLLVCKPVLGSCGRGIFFVRSKDLTKKIRDKRLRIIQEYVEPYLIDNTKFDIRMYVFIDHLGNFRLSRHGLIRLAYTQYSHKTLNPKTHLTNTSLSPKRCRMMPFKEWKDAETFFPKIEKVVGDVIRRFHRRCASKTKGVHLLGFDIAIEKNGGIKILEINRRPSLFPINPIQYKIKQEMMNEYVDFWEATLNGPQDGA